MYISDYIATQHNALYRKLKLLQYRNAVIGAEAVIRALQHTATQIQGSMKKALHLAFSEARLFILSKVVTTHSMVLNHKLNYNNRHEYMTVVVNFNGYKTLCLLSYDKPIDSPCSSNPCHDGTCGEVENGYICACPPNTIGVNCEVILPCAFEPCQNGGQCFNGDEIRYFCLCAEGYSGTDCEIGKL